VVPVDGLTNRSARRGIAIRDVRSCRPRRARPSTTNGARIGEDALRLPAPHGLLSQVELAARADMTQPALSRLEAGGVVPTIPLLERISAALDADLIVELAPHAA
jgi:hypothetical protein